MGRASRRKKERNLRPGLVEVDGREGGFVGGRPVDAEMRPVLPPLAAEYRARQVDAEGMWRWKLSTPQPTDGVGASEILRRVRVEGEAPVMVNRSPGGAPEALVWVCPGCGNTWTVETTTLVWVRSGRDLQLSYPKPLLCPESLEGRCPSAGWTLTADTLVKTIKEA